MTLYELHAHRTACYDRKAECRVRLSTKHGGDPIGQWVRAYLAKYVDGVVVIYRIEDYYRKTHKRYVRTEANPQPQGVKS